MSSQKNHAASTFDSQSLEPSYQYEVVTDEDSFVQLRDQWNDLWIRSQGNFVQTFTYNFYCWKHIAQFFGRKLCIVIQTDQNRLVSILALTSERKGVWRLLRPLSLVANEFSDILTVKDNRYYEKVALLFEFVLKNVPNDVLNFPFVKHSSPFYAVLRSSALHILSEEVDVAYYADFSSDKSWQQYQASLSGDHRRSLNRRRRHIESLGTISYLVVSDREPLLEAIQWLLETKKQWVIKNNKIDPWMFTDHYHNLLNAIASNGDKVNSLVAFVLKLNDDVISIKLVSVNVGHVDRIMAAYDEKHAKDSPGMLLDEFVIKWCFDHKLLCDLGVGSEKSKQIWSRGKHINTSNMLVASTKWGLTGYVLSNQLSNVKTAIAKFMTRLKGKQ